MKKLILIALVLVSTQSFSQSLLQKFEFGLKGGVNVSNFTNANFPTDPLIGFNAGATVAFKFTDNFMVQEDFLFSTGGAKIKGGKLGTQDLKLSYFSVPIVLKYRTNSGFYAEAGAQAAFKVKEDVGGLTDIKFAKKYDVGAVGGIGYQSKIGLGIGARYVYGIQKVFDSNTLVNDFKNNTIQANIFYVF
ncbi:Opacity protein [Mucilaginibacter pineti]|uniref:Opacity protein n=1 Tax=Mucilaginibacter pineti TaxID=1391627 RepID=A0A1G6UIA7_9SPHI|nr:porin family protein [Mucilaginibacter pineti]SDD41001.1 Opacity protein [Mucilaginibacter pineti]